MKKDNKKIIVIGALVMVLCAVGAFTMLGGGGSPAPSGAQATTKASATKEDAKPKVDPAQAAINNLIGNMSGYGTTETRDPFAIPAGAKKAVEAPPTPPVQAPEPEKAHRSTPPPRLDGGGGKPWQIPLDPGKQLPAQIVPRFKVKGVLVGQKSVVVIEDSNGNQRLVPQGGQLDPTTRVTNIEKGQITVNENGKSKTLPIEEGS